MRMFTDHNAKNTFVIDKSNDYPVVVTTNVTKKTPWLNILNKHGIKFANPKGDSIEKEINGKIYNWVPTHFYDRGPGGDYFDEEYKNVFLQLRYHGHIDDYESYLEVLNRFELRYDKDKDLRQLIAEYINLKNMKWNKSFKKFNWKKLSTYFTCESNDIEKNFIKIENELINIFNRI